MATGLKRIGTVTLEVALHDDRDATIEDGDATIDVDDGYAITYQLSSNACTRQTGHTVQLLPPLQFSQTSSL